MSDSNLWPENLDDETSPDDAPSATLERAAQELERRTGGKVVGEVQTRGTGDKLEHSFYLRATEVDYRYFMFKVRHTIDGFPVELIASGDASPKLFSSPEAFEDELRRLFREAHTLSVVNRLRNLAREIRPNH